MRKLFTAKQRIKRLGVDNMTTLADRLKALDKVLALFNMRVGADPLIIDATSGFVSVQLTVYFIKEPLKIHKRRHKL